MSTRLTGLTAELLQLSWLSYASSFSLPSPAGTRRPMSEATKGMSNRSPQGSVTSRSCPHFHRLNIRAGVSTMAAHCISRRKYDSARPRQRQCQVRGWHDSHDIRMVRVRLLHPSDDRSAAHDTEYQYAGPADGRLIGRATSKEKLIFMKSFQRASNRWSRRPVLAYTFFVHTGILYISLSMHLQRLGTKR